MSAKHSQAFATIASVSRECRITIPVISHREGSGVAILVTVVAFGASFLVAQSLNIYRDRAQAVKILLTVVALGALPSCRVSEVPTVTGMGGGL